MFAVTKTKRDGHDTIVKFVNLNDAMLEGKRIFDAAEKGELVSVIEADFDENDQIIGAYKLYQSWW